MQLLASDFMGPPLYEIDELIEKQVQQAVQNYGALVQHRRALKKTPEGEEQYWSVICDDREVLCYSVMVEIGGRRLLVMGPKRPSQHIQLYDLIITTLESSGAKRVEKL